MQMHRGVWTAAGVRTQNDARKHTRSRRTQRFTAVFGLLALLGTFLPFTSAQTATAATAADITLTPFVSGLSEPVAITAWRSQPGSLLVVERRGTVQRIIDGFMDAEPWLDIRDQVQSAEGEQGLLGIALTPDQPNHPYVYVMYTALDGANTVSRFRVTQTIHSVDHNSEEILLSIPDRAPNHNGGMLAFGPDGHLYIGTGDEGGGGDTYENAQDLSSLYGKILRLDVQGASAEPYSIPADNLVATNPKAAPEIWAYGLRNPWRFSFDRATGDLWIADVGQEFWEEVNLVPAGSPAGINFGWNVSEGTHCYGEEPCDTGGYHLPVMEYGHIEGCSVTGGYRYRGYTYPDAIGAYLFGDFCSGDLWMAREVNGQWNRGEPLDTGRSITAFGEDGQGELYLADISNGTIYRLHFGGGLAPAGAERWTTWTRTDAPVADGVANRSWIWGPYALTPELQEPYTESVGGTRGVQYFDKARMEITHIWGDPTSIWYVTNGLLVVEMMSGRIQVGDDEFIDASPARVPVAGDLDDPNGITYATLGTLRSATAVTPGTVLDWRIDAAGNLVQGPALAAYGAVAAERVTVPGLDHTVANVFWEFMNSSGLVEITGQLITDRLFLDPFYATGLPITEAYWTTARVAGTPRDVLVQCFERRCLTWTPDNSEGWQVEAANVGLHYLAWREQQDTPNAALSARWER